MIPGTRASWATGLELALGLLIAGWMLAGVRLAWRGRRAEHVAAMKRLPFLMALFLAVFLGNAALRGGVEALQEPGASRLLGGLLALHVLLSLLGGVLLVLLLRWGWLGERGGHGGARALALHRRWAGFTAGYWLVNTLLGALVFWAAYLS